MCEFIKQIYENNPRVSPDDSQEQSLMRSVTLDEADFVKISPTNNKRTFIT